MKKISKVFFVLSLSLCIIVLIKVIIKISNNKIFINNYLNKNQEYRLKTNTIINLYEPYVVYYNYGNFLFQNGQFDEAKAKYLKALEYDVPSNNLCKINMNIALTLYKQTEGMNNTNKIKLLKEADSYLQQCLNVKTDNNLKISTMLLLFIIILGSALIILALIIKQRMGLFSNSDSNCLKRLEEIKKNLLVNEDTIRESYTKIQMVIYDFVKSNTKVDISNLSKDEIIRLGIGDLNLLMENLYSINFNNISNLEIIEKIDKMMEVIKKWKWK